MKLLGVKISLGLWGLLLESYELGKVVRAIQLEMFWPFLNAFFLAAVSGF